MEPDWATKIAAQLWCKPEHESKVMDVAFATSIASALRKAKGQVYDAIREATSREAKPE